MEFYLTHVAAGTFSMGSRWCISCVGKLGMQKERKKNFNDGENRNTLIDFHFYDIKLHFYLL